MLAVVTGATGGLGFEVAAALAQAGHDVVLAGRNADKGAAALTRLNLVKPKGVARYAPMDMANLASIRAFAAGLDGPVGLLVNNAGVMAVPKRQETADGLELQMGTNYFGHYALTALLMPRLMQGRARVVQVSSLAHRGARLNFADLQGAKRYRPWTQYGQSKLAMLMFALELDRRAKAAGWPIVSVAAHPGWSVTDIIANGPGGGAPGFREKLMQSAFQMFGQSAAAGARPILHAALAGGVTGGTYWGPDGSGERTGAPGPSRIMPQAMDAEMASRLWERSALLTGVTWPG